MTGPNPSLSVERVQTGVWLEIRLRKVLKAVADLKEMTLGDLLEGIVLHAFEGKSPFTPETIGRVQSLKEVFGLHLDATASHRLTEEKGLAAVAHGPR